jgi:hypothetical protein
MRATPRLEALELPRLDEEVGEYTGHPFWTRRGGPCGHHFDGLEKFPIHIDLGVVRIGVV